MRKVYDYHLRSVHNSIVDAAKFNYVAANKKILCCWNTDLQLANVLFAATNWLFQLKSDETGFQQQNQLCGSKTAAARFCGCKQIFAAAQERTWVFDTTGRFCICRFATKICICKYVGGGSFLVVKLISVLLNRLQFSQLQSKLVTEKC